MPSHDPRPVLGRTTSSDARPSPTPLAASTELPRPRSGGNGRNESSSSRLLHDLLMEKRAQSHKLDRSNRDRDGGHPSRTVHMSERLIRSSPIGAPQNSRRRSVESKRASSAGLQDAADPRGMGAREMDEHLSTIHKQNFDLKLEVFQRRRRMTALEEQVREMDKLKTANAELQEVNEELLQELEKRDRAVEEAIGIICDLEERIELFEEDSTQTTGQSDPAGHRRDARESFPPSSPPQLPLDAAWPKTPNQDATSKEDTSRSKGMTAASYRLIDLATPQSAQARTPSFLRSEKGSVSALRSLYLASENGSKTFSSFSLPRRENETVRDGTASEVQDHMIEGLDSPRLSVLSESSFLSVYGKTRGLDLTNLDDNLDDEPGSIGASQDDVRNDNNTGERRSTVEKVEKWIEGRRVEKRVSFLSRSAGGSEGTSTVGDVERSNDDLSTRSLSIKSSHPARRSDESDIWAAAKPDYPARGRGNPFQSLGHSEAFDNSVQRNSSTTIAPQVSPKALHLNQPPPESPRRAISAYKTRKRSGVDNVPHEASFMQGPIFDHGFLPPTPDTLSTVDLHGRYLSPTDEHESSLLDGTPAPARTFSALAPYVPSRSASRTNSPKVLSPSEDSDPVDDGSGDTSSNVDSGSARAVKSDVEGGLDPSSFPTFAAPSPSAWRTSKKTRPNTAYQSSYSGDMMFNGEGIRDFASSLTQMPERQQSSMELSHGESLRSGLPRLEVGPWPRDPKSGGGSDNEKESPLGGTRPGDVGKEIYTNPQSIGDPITPRSQFVEQTSHDSPSSRTSNTAQPPSTPSPSKRNSFRARFLGHRSTSQQDASSQRKNEPDPASQSVFGSIKSHTGSQIKSIASGAVWTDPRKGGPEDLEHRPVTKYISEKPQSSASSVGQGSRNSRGPLSYWSGNYPDSTSNDSTEKTSSFGGRRWGLGRNSSVKVQDEKRE
ncbi:MAG: hypothetical protein M1837_004418 [Sclerophora amabilis]|nr:MAG: hypothetical protein M1837_004418 [Sclerophora amabilis]